MIKNNDEGDDENGWQSIADIDQIVDLLELTGGESILLVDDFELPSGMLNQIRLVLGEENTIVIEGEEEPIPLKTQSAQQSGLKLKMNH
jgi:gamma-glutamylcysteine synthetase